MKTLLLGTILLSSFATAQKPDLHAGGPKPSLLPNHETTKVTLPGLHLAGTTVTVKGSCTLKSSQVVSDTQITMMIEAHRQISDTEDGCFLTVHRGALTAGTYVVLDLTPKEWDQKRKTENAEQLAKAKAYMASLGQQWNLHYSDGSSDIYTVQPASPGELPEYKNTGGDTVKIMTSGSKVVIVGSECMRQGTLAAGQVKDGVSVGNCKPPGLDRAIKVSF